MLFKKIYLFKVVMGQRLNGSHDSSPDLLLYLCTDCLYRVIEKGLIHFQKSYFRDGSVPNLFRTASLETVLENFGKKSLYLNNQSV